jgi:pimeloyl-ACP methyl ester carboxylesterase
MPFAYNGSIKIHYQVSGNPAGPPLLLHHGFTQNLYSWHMKGYVKGLGDSSGSLRSNRFRLILPDARGHGQSDKPHGADAYEMGDRVNDILAILDALNIERTHFFGYSMGGRVGFALAQQAPERLHRLVIGGAHPGNEDLAAFEGVDGTDATAFITAFEAMIGESLSPLAQEFVKANDLVALAAAAQPRPSLIADLSQMDLPILLFAGERDRRLAKIQACAQQLPQAQFELLEGVNHVEAIADSSMVLPILEAFF